MGNQANQLNSRVLLSHTYTGRPLSAGHLLPRYLAHPAPRPSLIYLPNTNPSTLVFSVTHGNLLFLLTTSSDIEPLLVLEFIHRIIDVLEEFIGTPLLATKIENSYDVVAQLLNEMCDAGTIATTEPNALRDLVEVEGFLGKLLGGMTGYVLPLHLWGQSYDTRKLTGDRNNSNAISTPMQALSSMGSVNTPALPWRRSNVKHISPRLYVDIVETLSIILAPSGRPLSAFANGTIAFTCEVSGTPDIYLSLSTPGGKQNIESMMELPVFHPCVRLAHWGSHPGELSFVPPDGRCVLAGYEVNLLPSDSITSKSNQNLKLPVSLEVKTSRGPTGSQFEVRLLLSPPMSPQPSSSSGSGSGGGSGRGPTGRGATSSPFSSSTPKSNLEGLRVTIPMPAEVRNLSEMRASRGETTYAPGASMLEWSIPLKEAGTGAATLRATAIGNWDDDEEEEEATNNFSFANEYDDGDGGYQTSASPKKQDVVVDKGKKNGRKIKRNKLLMPTSARVSFGVKGWLASGLKVDRLEIDQRKSRGVEGGMKLFKGVKYLTASQGGVEVRC